MEYYEARPAGGLAVIVIVGGLQMGDEHNQFAERGDNLGGQAILIESTTAVRFNLSINLARNLTLLMPSH